VNSTLRFLPLSLFFLWCAFTAPIFAGTWSDHFSESVLGADWRGDRDYFSIRTNALSGQSAFPLAPSPFHVVEVGTDWDDYTVQCLMNIVTPNLRVCTKGALLVRHRGNEGYVFALHAATQTLEVYRLSDHEMLLTREAPLEFRRWYRVRCELRGAIMSFFVDDELIGIVSDNRIASGAVGLAVQDAEEVQFDDFSVTGPKVPANGLEMALSTQDILVTWPSALTNYLLQTAPRLSPDLGWTTITNSKTTIGDKIGVSFPRPNGNVFYRLYKP
jgi:hypothetical protein